MSNILWQRDEFSAFWESYRDRPLAGRNEILASLCPQVYGLYVVKLAVALVLTGGVQVSDVHATRDVRGYFRECSLGGEEVLGSNVMSYIIGKKEISGMPDTYCLFQRVDESGTRVRGESHLLLVGDPGRKADSIIVPLTLL